MRRGLIIAAVLIAAGPMARATTYLFTSGTLNSPTETTTGANPITVWGFTYTGSGSGNTPPFTGVQASNLTYNSSGLGVAGTSSEIVYGSTSRLVVFDFADTNGPKPNHLTTVTFHIDNADSNWFIYGGNAAPTTGTLSGLTRLYTSPTTNGTANSGNGSMSISLSGYDYLAVTAGTTCELNIGSIDVTAAPEPGTSLMAGMALIGLGVALRKARKGQ